MGITSVSQSVVLWRSYIIDGNYIEYQSIHGNHPTNQNFNQIFQFLVSFKLTHFPLLPVRGLASQMSKSGSRARANRRRRLLYMFHRQRDSVSHTVPKKVLKEGDDGKLAARHPLMAGSVSDTEVEEKSKGSSLLAAPPVVWKRAAGKRPPVLHSRSAASLRDVAVTPPSESVDMFDDKYVLDVDRARVAPSTPAIVPVTVAPTPAVRSSSLSSLMSAGHGRSFAGLVSHKLSRTRKEVTPELLVWLMQASGTDTDTDDSTTEEESICTPLPMPTRRFADALSDSDESTSSLEG